MVLFHWAELNWWCSWDLEKKNTSKRVNSWVSKVMLYKVFLWEILYDHFAEVSCVSFSCKYEYALWIKTHFLLQQAPSYSVSKIESRIPLSSEGQWFYPVLNFISNCFGYGISFQIFKILDFANMCFIKLSICHSPKSYGIKMEEKGPGCSYVTIITFAFRSQKLSLA